MLTESRRRQKHKSAWAQVMPAVQSEELRTYCEFCKEGTYSWIINGRTDGLTRTATSYSCGNCLYPALSSLRWK